MAVFIDDKIVDPVVLSTAPLGDVARTTAETSGLLDKWAVKDEQKLRDAQTYIQQAQARRNLALAAVDAVLEKAGIDATTRDVLIENATALRNALAPFDVPPPGTTKG